MHRIGGIFGFSISLVFLALVGTPVITHAQQPSVAAAVNAASYLNASLPNGKLAQGGMFILFGARMGPATLRQVSAFPLPTSLEGTSIRVTVGNTTVDCIMIYTSAGQVAAILPSSTPVGNGTLTLTYNGQPSAPFSIQVGASNFGTFSINQGGSGPGVILNANTNQANTLVTAANPGQLMDIWGTGLGPVGGNEAGGPLPGNQSNVSVQVSVGSVQAEIAYRGRSGCCAGIDQIRFRVPSGQTGCYIPVVVTVQGVPSNFTTMSIADSGSVCSDPNGFSAEELQALQSGGNFRSASVLLTRGRTQVVGSTLTRSDQASAGFVRYNLQQILGQNTQFPAVGSCIVNQITSGTAQPTGLNAGSVSLSGPPGSYNLIVNPGFVGSHFLSFSPGVPPGIPGVIGDGTLLTPGGYTVTGTGGTDVGPFNVSVTLQALFEWTNREAISAVNRSQALNITWSGGAAGHLILITGTSPLSGTGSTGAFFLCAADATAGSFAVPATVLGSLPPSAGSGGSLSVAQFFLGARFRPSGVDFGQAITADFISKSVSFQ